VAKSNSSKLFCWLFLSCIKHWILFPLEQLYVFFLGNDTPLDQTDSSTIRIRNSIASPVVSENGSKSKAGLYFHPIKAKLKWWNHVL
jgi:hypothetical protein